ncbi:hypothetical protein JCGZ_23922 [Jatropha curcas]|uniref:Uncharacterized protein n=1 Tax=Jatropha curcas TaxID=180498 RepID=A0A067JPH8_JATCU|nr:hypothetical protein JCGZ_23922 [Jatropha curcas]
MGDSKISGKKTGERFCASRGQFIDLFDNVFSLPHMAEKYGREPTPIEVFTYTHTKDHNLNTFVDRRAVSVNENYTTALERLVSFEAESAIETSRLLAEKYGREPTPIEVFTYTHTKDHDLNTFVYRRAVSVNASQFYCSLASHASAASAGPEPEHSAEEFTALRARVDEQERQLAKLRAHVMRMSGQPGAGTSSSDPAPATDRNVLTSQQQPLPSPDPDAADNTLVTPADTTAHPAGTPPGDSTLDCADDHPCRFDFEPF